MRLDWVMDAVARVFYIPTTPASASITAQVTIKVTTEVTAEVARQLQFKVSPHNGPARIKAGNAAAFSYQK